MARTPTEHGPAHRKQRGRAAAATHEQTTGPVPMHHRLRLGQTDGVSDPNGVGQPSTDNKVRNGDGKTY